MFYIVKLFGLLVLSNGSDFAMAIAKYVLYAFVPLLLVNIKLFTCTQSVYQHYTIQGNALYLSINYVSFICLSKSFIHSTQHKITASFVWLVRVKLSHQIFICKVKDSCTISYNNLSLILNHVSINCCFDQRV